MNDTILRHTWETPVGIIEVVINDERIQSIQIVNTINDHNDEHPLIDLLKKQMDEYVNGERRVFGIPVDLVGTPFQRSVWKATSKIPHGTTATYGEIARSIGRPGAARAVGGALNKNPLLIIVPCHRVLGSDGSLAGFACGTGVKERLLALERSAAVSA